MTRTKMVVVGLMLFTVQGAQGQETQLGHLKKDNPNELNVMFAQNEYCLGSYERIVNNELIKSRIKKLVEFAEMNVPILWVSITCTPMDSGTGLIFNIDVDFVRRVPAYNPQPGELSWTIITHSPSYGNHGYIRDSATETEQFISSALRGFVENALSDYLRINFDL